MNFRKGRATISRIAAVAAAIMAARAGAQTATGWKGGSGSLWSTTANWDNGAPGGNIRDLFFGNSIVAGGSTSPLDDISGYAGYHITFQNTATVSFTLSLAGGKTMPTLFDFSQNSPRIENDSAVTQNISFPMAFSATSATGQTAQVDPASGNLSFASSLDLAGTTQLVVASGNGKTVTFGGAITSSGNTSNNGFLLSGASVVQFAAAAANTYLGATTVNAGTLQLNSTVSDGAITKSALVIGDGTGVDTVQYLHDAQIDNSATITVNSSGVLDFNGHNDTIGSMTVNEGKVTLGAGSLSMGLLTMTGGSVSSTSGGELKIGNSPNLSSGTDNSSATISGTLSLNGQNRTFTVGHTGASATIDVDIPANIIDSSGSHSLTKAGVGVLRLGGSNSYVGDTVISAGTLSFSADNNLGIVPSPALANDIQLSGGAIQTTATFSLDPNRGITLSSTGTINATGGDLTVGGAITGGANRLTVTGANIVTLNGGLTSTSDILKQGSGTLRLTTSNNFGAGASNVFMDKGGIEVSANGALGNTNGTTGLVNLGSSNSGSAGDVSLLITAANVTVANPIDSRFFTGISTGKTIGGTNTSGSVAFTGGLTLHDNTTLTSAAGGIVSFGGAIVTGVANSPTSGEAVNATPPSGGFGTGPGVIVNSASGGGTVELTGASTYTGDTVVNGGTLQYNGSFTGASTIRLGASTGSANAAVNIADATGATFNQVINIRPGSSGVKTISATNISGTTTLSNHIALDDNGTIFSANAGATLALTSVRTSPTDTISGIDIKNFTATFDGAGDTNVSGTIYNSTGGGNIIKQGTGALTLSGTATYSGLTTVNQGTLAVNGQIANSSGVVVGTAGGSMAQGTASLPHSGGTRSGTPLTPAVSSGSAVHLGQIGPVIGGVLAGTGSVAAPVSINNGGAIAPGNVGNSIANFTLNGGGTFAAGGTYSWEVNALPETGVAGTNWDTLTLNSLSVTASAGSKFTIKVTSLNGLGNAAGVLTGMAGVPGTTHRWHIGIVSGALSIDPSVFAIDTSAFTADGEGTWSVGQSGNNLDLDFVEVPEPTAGALLLGAASLLFRRTRRKPRRRR